MPDQQENNGAKARRQLQAVVADQKFGDRILQDASLCESVLRDVCGECRREIAVIVTAVRAGVPRSLSVEQSATPKTALRARLIQKLADEHALTNELAGWAVDSWMMALGIAPPAAGKPPSHWGSAVGVLALCVAIGAGIWLWQTRPDGTGTHQNDAVDQNVVGTWEPWDGPKANSGGSALDGLSRLPCTMHIGADGSYTLTPYCPPGTAFMSGKITINHGNWQMRTSDGRTLSGVYTLAGPLLTLSSSTFVLTPMRFQRSFGDYVRP